MGLCALALIIFGYRAFGGTNDWLRTHGIILVTYYALGSVVYDEIEGWPLIDSSYFLTVTITTVGYGDLTPTTDVGKMFTVVYALVGVIFVFAALTPLVTALGFIKEGVLAPFKPTDLEPNDVSGAARTAPEGRAAHARAARAARVRQTQPAPRTVLLPPPAACARAVCVDASRACVCV